MDQSYRGLRGKIKGITGMSCEHVWRNIQVGDGGKSCVVFSTQGAAGTGETAFLGGSREKNCIGKKKREEKSVAEPPESPPAKKEVRGPVQTGWGGLMLKKYTQGVTKDNLCTI